jgi:hypothetical protein
MLIAGVGRNTVTIFDYGQGFCRETHSDDFYKLSPKDSEYDWDLSFGVFLYLLDVAEWKQQS